MRLRRRSFESGLSLVEVLLALAVVVILAMVLVVYLAHNREQAARRRCMDNLKQLGLAMHTYQATYSRFPIGARCHLRRGDETQPPELGHSFLVGILPYLEANGPFDKWAQDSDWANSTGPDGVSRLERVKDLEISTYRCPASSVSTFVPVRGVNVLLPSYVGISGATNDASSGVPKKGLDGFTDLRESRTKYGILSASGVLVPNQSISVDDIRDGTTNQILIAEQSDLYSDSEGSYRNFHSAFSQGAFAGTDFSGTPPDAHWENASPRVYNLTTVRYGMNYKQPVAAGPGSGFSDDGNPGHNAGIVSPHPGVAFVAVGDGSVKALTEAIDRLTLYRLCTRDDGGVRYPGIQEPME
jgi:type II secretory pathway pseudopilin PulG